MVLDEYIFADKIRSYCIKQGIVENIECKVVGNYRMLPNSWLVPPFLCSQNIDIDVVFDCETKKGNKIFRYNIGSKKLDIKLTDEKSENTIEAFIKEIAGNYNSNLENIKDEEIKDYAAKIKEVKDAVDYKTKGLWKSFVCSRDTDMIFSVR